MNIVIDTNVIVSGLLSDMGASHRLLERLPDDQFDVCVSVALILEYEAQLKRRLPREVFTDEDIDDFIDYLCRIAIKTPVYYLWRPYLKDPFDDHILELALASQSKYVVTFNKRDFQQAERYGLEAVTPGEFLDRIQKGK